MTLGHTVSPAWTVKMLFEAFFFFYSKIKTITCFSLWQPTLALWILLQVQKRLKGKKVPKFCSFHFKTLPWCHFMCGFFFVCSDSQTEWQVLVWPSVQVTYSCQTKSRENTTLFTSLHGVAVSHSTHSDMLKGLTSAGFMLSGWQAGCDC